MAIYLRGGKGPGDDDSADKETLICGAKYLEARKKPRAGSRSKSSLRGPARPSRASSRGLIRPVQPARQDGRRAAQTARPSTEPPPQDPPLTTAGDPTQQGWFSPLYDPSLHEPPHRIPQATGYQALSYQMPGFPPSESLPGELGSHPPPTSLPAHVTPMPLTLNSSSLEPVHFNFLFNDRIERVHGFYTSEEETSTISLALASRSKAGAHRMPPSRGYGYQACVTVCFPRNNTDSQGGFLEVEIWARVDFSPGYEGFYFAPRARRKIQAAIGSLDVGFGGETGRSFDVTPSYSLLGTTAVHAPANHGIEGHAALPSPMLSSRLNADKSAYPPSQFGGSATTVNPANLSLNQPTGLGTPLEYTGSTGNIQHVDTHVYHDTPSLASGPTGDNVTTMTSSQGHPSLGYALHQYVTGLAPMEWDADVAGHSGSYDSYLY